MNSSSPLKEKFDCRDIMTVHQTSAVGTTLAVYEFPGEVDAFFTPEEAIGVDTD